MIDLSSKKYDKRAKTPFTWLIVGISSLVIGFLVPPVLLISLIAFIIFLITYIRYARKRVKAGEITWKGEDPNDNRVIYPINNKRTQRALERTINKDEEIKVQMTAGSGQTLVATSKRVIIIKPGWLAGASFGTKVTQFNYQTISSIEVRFGLMSGVFEVSASGMQGTDRRYLGSGKNSAYAAPNCIPLTQRDQLRFERAANIVQDLIADFTRTPSVQINSDPTEQIRKLALLLNNGLITNDEYEVKKTELLKQI